MADISKGDSVSWNSRNGKTSGKVVGKVTHDKQVGSHQAKASASDPQYEVASDKSGKHAIHKPDSLEKK